MHDPIAHRNFPVPSFKQTPDRGAVSTRLRQELPFRRRIASPSLIHRLDRPPPPPPPLPESLRPCDLPPSLDDRPSPPPPHLLLTRSPERSHHPHRPAKVKPHPPPASLGRPPGRGGQSQVLRSHGKSHWPRSLAARPEGGGRVLTSSRRNVRSNGHRQVFSSSRWCVFYLCREETKTARSLGSPK